MKSLLALVSQFPDVTDGDARACDLLPVEVHVVDTPRVNLMVVKVAQVRVSRRRERQRVGLHVGRESKDEEYGKRDE